MDAIFAKYPNAGAGRRARETARENVESNILWKEKNTQIIHNWLTNQWKTKRN